MDRYISRPLEVVRSIKNVVTAASQLSQDKALSREKDILCGMWHGPAHKAAIIAFAKASKK